MFRRVCPGEGCMKAKVRLRIDADLLRQARELTAEQGLSVDALVSDLLAGFVRDREAFQKARSRVLARLRQGIDLHWSRPSSRDSLYWQDLP